MIPNILDAVVSAAALLQIEFSQLILDECQQIGSSSSHLCSLMCAVQAQQRLLMSGEFFE
jgi:hypothetical protein